jgi:MoxR-like ATPase
MSKKMTAFDKFSQAAEAFKVALIEREDEVDLLLTAAIIGDNFLMLGAPGTAKTLLAELWADVIDAKIFKRTLTKYSMPDELFGILDLRGYKEGEYRRLTANKLPEAEIVVINEVFKGSSAILNSLLTITNEGTFEDGNEIRQTPVKTMIGTSNEFPKADQGLDAFADRWLIRKHVKPVATSAGLHRLMWASPEDLTPDLGFKISGDEIDKASAEAQALKPSSECEHSYHAIVKELRRNGVMTGCRRIRQSTAAINATAWLAGSKTVEPEHLSVLEHTMWNDPDQHNVTRDIVTKIANPEALKLNTLKMEAESIVEEADMTNVKSLTDTGVRLKKVYKQVGKLKQTSKASRISENIESEMCRIKTILAESLEFVF